MKLTLSNIAKVFFCTGARNHDLLKYFDPEKIVFEYDERMASFKALGLGRISKDPVIICCTSGTAVAECIPALLEAQYSQSPLILISGDRPRKMHGTGAPQTINHESLTKGIATYIEIGLDEFPHLSVENIKGPIHINVLVDDSFPHDKEVLSGRTLEDFRKFLKGSKSPLFLFSHESESMREFIQNFKSTGIPFYAESLSQARDLSVLDSEKTLVRMLKENKFDAVIRVGHTPLSKVWRLLEMNHLKLFSFDSRNLAAMSYGEVSSLSSHELEKSPEFWDILKDCPKKNFVSDSSLENLLLKYPNSEMSVARRIQDYLKPGSVVYLGNSLIIRFFELTQKKQFRIFGSRGVNGIDGQLSTAIGIALGTRETVTCILGDITTLYDLSALREMPENLKLIIVNNAGGRIFDMLGLDKRIVMEHKNSFESICSGLDVSYGRHDLSLLSSVQVLELNPDHASTLSFLKEWNS